MAHNIDFDPLTQRVMAKRLKASERKASILAVAKVLFADKGYHGVSVDEIATRLAVSPAVLYQHFPSKHALYEAVLDEISCKRESYVDAIVAEPNDFPSVLRRMTKIYTKSVSRDPDYLVMEMHSVLEGAPAAQQFFENRWKTFTDFIEFSLTELARDKRINRSQPKIAALCYQGMLREALYAKCIYKTDRFGEYELSDLIEEIIQIFLHAINYKDS